METKDVIKKLRLERGWTQEELGKKMGVQKAAVNKWEVGSVELKRTILQKLAEVFNVSPIMFFKPDIETVAAHHDAEEWTDETLFFSG